MIELSVIGSDPIELEVAPESAIEWGAEEYMKVRYSDLPDYEGATEWEPKPYAQTIPTSGFSMRSNLTINPIPSNYGRIDWNGAALTVS